MLTTLHCLFLLAVVSIATAGSCGNGQKTKRYCYTRWLNRDRPSGTGDYETLNHVLSKACPRPVGIQCQTTSGQDYKSTGNVLAQSCNPQFGLICVSSQQPAGVRCQDYKVRFLCPENTIRDKRGIVCQDFCESRFFNRDHPSGWCDCEPRRLSAYRGPTPVGVRCIESATRRDYRDVGQKMTCKADDGAHCWNHLNPGNRCKDYSIQYIYPCKGEEVNEQLTQELEEEAEVEEVNDDEETSDSDSDELEQYDTEPEDILRSLLKQEN